MQSETIDGDNYSSVEWDGNHFRFCEFADFHVEGGCIASDFVQCSFKELDWYWGIFCGCNFIECRFVNCLFRGTAFMSSRFVDCSFENCRFAKDNLDSDCDFSETIAYGCKVEGGEGFQAKRIA